MKLHLIGIHGNAQSGKDTACSYLNSTFQNNYRIAFADALKESCAAAFGIPLNDFYDEHKKEVENKTWSRSPREIAQYMGTEVFRQGLNDLLPEDIRNDFWIHRLNQRITNIYVPEDEGKFNDGDCIVIPDVRFQNEYDWIISNGGSVIHITRPYAIGLVGIPGHASEQKINLHAKEFTYEVANNGTIKDLEEKVHTIFYRIRQSW